MKAIDSDVNDALQLVNWPVQNVLAFTSTCHYPSVTHRPHSVYGDFNLGDHVGDDTQKVLHNRNVLLSHLPEHTSIQWLKQTHGNNVAEIDHYSEQAIVADAAITRRKEIALAIMTADCLPIMLASLNGDEIAVIHGGWRPLANNIIKNTYEKMHSDSNNICAWLGPCIGPTAFEVGQDVVDIFLAHSKNFKIAFSQIKNNDKDSKKFLANLHLIAQLQLNDLGITSIYRLSHCTFSMKDDYYSYRRKKKTGRMASIISRL